jgi:hypothetical protein
MRDDTPADIALLARHYGVRAIQRLSEILHSEDHTAAVTAATTLLGYGFGAPALPIAFDANGVQVEVHTGEQDSTQRVNGKHAWDVG